MAYDSDEDNTPDADDKSRGNRMSEWELKALLDAEKMSALASIWSSQLSADRDDALMYYTNDMSKDMPAADGRSEAVSSDTADTIEGLMPSLIEIFCGCDDVMKFNPQNADDVMRAEQETDYVNHVFMVDNPGFLNLYTFIKDALLSKVGILKFWWEDKEEIEEERYRDLTDDQYAILKNDPEVEVIEHESRQIEDPLLLQALQPPISSLPAPPAPNPGAPPQQGMATGPGAGNPLPGGAPQGPPQGALPAGLAAGAPPPTPSKPPMFHDVKVERSKKFGRVRIEPVAPEEFGIEKTARRLTQHDCNYCFHRRILTVNRLIEQGYDRDIIDALPTYTAITMPEEINRDTVAEHQNVGTEHNPAARRVEIFEHYVRMDYEGRGRAKLYKVCTGSEQGQLLEKDGEIDLEEIDDFPFAAMTPIIITHRFFGRSIADIVKDIQKIKTALLRAVLDNAYLANNPRVEVAESHASDNTLDDLLISRPGGIVRSKQPGGINWQAVPTIGSHVFPLLEYEDSVLETRTGVTKQGQGLDASALQNQSATATNQMFTMAQARMRLIARIFAETGIKDAFLKVHQYIRKYGDEAKTVRLRGQWVNVDPRDWKKRDDMTVDVGLGTGGKAEQMSLLTVIGTYQEKALVAGLTNLVTPQNLFNTAKAITRIAGHKDVSAFFTDPSTQPPPQQKPDPKVQIAQMKTQGDQQLAQMKMKLEATHEQAKFQADSALNQQKFQHEKELNMMEMQMKQQESQHKMIIAGHQHEMDKQKMSQEMLLAQHQANLQQQQGQQQIEQQKESNALDMQLAQKKADHEQGMATQKQSHEIALQGGKPTAGSKSPTILEEIRDRISKPSGKKRVVRDASGRISHLEDMQ